MAVSEQFPAHLARIIVNPGYRAIGVGQQLVERIMAATIATSPPRCFTLNVYASNTPALSEASVPENTHRYMRTRIAK